MHKNKINLEEVVASLNTVCPSCGHSISAAEIRRIDFERMKCPKCDQFLRQADHLSSQLMAHDALGAHAPCELGMSEEFLCASDSGCVAIRCQLCCWGSPASIGHCPGPAGGVDSFCFWNFTRVSGPSRWVGRTCGRRRSDGGAMRVMFWGARWR